MRKLFIVFALMALALAASANASGQTPASSATPQADAGVTPNGVIGEVTAIDMAAKQMLVKTDAGSVVAVGVDEKTVYMRVPPGEKTLDKAVRIAATEVSKGDRVFARGKVADDRKSVPARILIVMTKADITKKQESEREEWQRRGIAGVISALNAESKEITVTMRGRGPAAAAQPVIISAAAPNVTFRRYTSDSVKFSDAKPSSFAELKVGDQVRALGDRSADGAHFTPQTIVSGSFRTIGGPVLTINAAANEVRLNDLNSKQPVTVVIRPDSVLRRIPPEMAAMMAMRMGGGAPGGASGQAGGGQSPTGGAAAAGGGATGRPGGGAAGGGGGGSRGGGVDFQEILERLPAITLAELKPGDMIIVSSTAGTEPGRVTAIAVVSGVEPLLNAMQARQAARPAGAAPQAQPNTGINFGIGLP